VRKLSDEAFKALDPLEISGGLNPYGEGDVNVFNMFRLGQGFYRDYIVTRTGFTGRGRVLDLLSGFGMWSIFLAEHNQEVYGLDILPNCKTYGERLARYFEVDNIKLLTGDVSRTREFRNGYFDFIWIYSGLQYVDRADTLKEVSRLLSPGGRLFVGNYNSQGLMLNYLMDGIKKNSVNEGVSQWALGALVAGPHGNGKPSFGTVDTIGDVVKSFGLRLIRAAGQGALDLAQPDGLRPGVKPTLVHEHYNITIEFVAEKPR
jgi:SAM-dependent methyltransferase